MITLTKHSLCLLALTFLVCVLGQRTRADEWPAPPVMPAPSDPKTKQKVDVQFKDTPLRRALDSLFKGSGLRVEVDKRIEDYPVTLEIRDIEFNTVVRVIVRQIAVRNDKITHQFRKGVYRIYIKPPHEEDPTTLK